jgi:hypothetical protein
LQVIIIIIHSWSLSLGAPRELLPKINPDRSLSAGSRAWARPLPSLTERARHAGAALALAGACLGRRLNKTRSERRKGAQAGPHVNRPLAFRTRPVLPPTHLQQQNKQSLAPSAVAASSTPPPLPSSPPPAADEAADATTALQRQRRLLADLEGRVAAADAKIAAYERAVEDLQGQLAARDLQVCALLKAGGARGGGGGGGGGRKAALGPALRLPPGSPRSSLSSLPSPTEQGLMLGVSGFDMEGDDDDDGNSSRSRSSVLDGPPTPPSPGAAPPAVAAAAAAGVATTTTTIEATRNPLFRDQHALLSQSSDSAAAAAAAEAQAADLAASAAAGARAARDGLGRSERALERVKQAVLDVGRGGGGGGACAGQPATAEASATAAAPAVDDAAAGAIAALEECNEDVKKALSVCLDDLEALERGCGAIWRC